MKLFGVNSSPDHIQRKNKTDPEAKHLLSITALLPRQTAYDHVRTIIVGNDMERMIYSNGRNDNEILLLPQSEI